MMASLDKPRWLERIPVSWLKDIVLVPVSAITHFEADNEMVAIHTAGATYSTDMTLTDLEARLDPDHFFRAHRKAIVNLDRIAEIQPLFHGECAILLKTGARLTLGRAYRERFHALFNV